MHLLQRDRTWTDPDADGVAYGPREQWGYDDGSPGEVSAAWTARDGTDISLTAPSGVGVSFTEPEASKVSEALERVLRKLGVKRPSLWAAGWRRNVLVASFGAAVFGGYCLAYYTLSPGGFTGSDPASVRRDLGGGTGGGAPAESASAEPAVTATVTAHPQRPHRHATAPAPRQRREAPAEQPTSEARPEQRPARQPVAEPTAPPGGSGSHRHDTDRGHHGATSDHSAEQDATGNGRGGDTAASEPQQTTAPATEDTAAPPSNSSDHDQAETGAGEKHQQQPPAADKKPGKLPAATTPPITG